MDKMIYLLAIAMLVSLYGCDEAPVEKISTPRVTESIDTDLSWWLVDWAMEDGVDETVKLHSELDRLVLFGGYVDDVGNLYQTDQSKKLIEEVFSTESLQEKPIYLTLVNDRFTGESVIQKDPGVITALLQDSALEAQYWEQVMKMLEQHPFTGVEIDFEKIPPTSYLAYTNFLVRAKERLDERGIRLRVVLEPSVSFSDMELPDEIEYVVMAYNLHGFHTPDDPGPKATYAFFDELHGRLKEGTDWTIALATGGFAFTEGEVTSLTEKDALALIPKGTEIVRDESSGVLHATFTEEGSVTSVWWADGETLKDWMNHWEQTYGYQKFSFWRAGEWSDDSLKVLSR